MFNVLKQVGNPVFFTGLSSAQTFNTGSLLRSSYYSSALFDTVHNVDSMLYATFHMPYAICHDFHTETVTNKLVPSTWRIWVIRPVSWARKLLTTFQLGPIIRTYPLSLPRNKLSDPEHTLDISLFSKKDRVSSSPSLT